MSLPDDPHRPLTSGVKRPREAVPDSESPIAASESTIPDDPVNYHPSHSHPPQMLQWFSRAKRKAADGTTSIAKTDPRWVFVQCCGMLGTPTIASDGSTFIKTLAPCDKAFEEETRTHTGTPVLTNRSVSQARLQGGAVAQWSCCGNVAVPPWNAAWDSHTVRRIIKGPWLQPCTHHHHTTTHHRHMSTSTTVAAAAPSVGGSLSDTAQLRALKAVVASDASVDLLLRQRLGNADFVGTAAVEKPSIEAPGVGEFAPLLPCFLLSASAHDREVREACWIKRRGGWGCAERAALKGDKLLSMAIVEILLEAYPTQQAGVLTDKVRDFICNQALSHVLTEHYGFKGTTLSTHEGGTIFEALLAATYSKHGYSRVREVVLDVYLFLDGEYERGVLSRAQARTTALAVLGTICQKAKVLQPKIEVRDRPTSTVGVLQFQAYYVVPAGDSTGLWRLESEWCKSKADARHQLAEFTLQALGA